MPLPSGPVAERHAHLLSLAVSQHDQRHLSLARLGSPKGNEQVRDFPNQLTFEARDDVTRSEPGRGAWRTTDGVDDENPLGCLEPALLPFRATAGQAITDSVRL